MSGSHLLAPPVLPVPVLACRGWERTGKDNLGINTRGREDREWEGRGRGGGGGGREGDGERGRERELAAVIVQKGGERTSGSDCSEREREKEGGREGRGGEDRERRERWRGGERGVEGD